MTTHISPVTKRIQAYGRMLYLLAFLPFHAGTFFLVGLVASVYLTDLRWGMAEYGVGLGLGLGILGVGAIMVRVGNGVRTFRGHAAGIVAAVLLLLAFPLGTVVGVYGLLALCNDEAKALFASH